MHSTETTGNGRKHGDFQTEIGAVVAVVTSGLQRKQRDVSSDVAVNRYECTVSYRTPHPKGLVWLRPRKRALVALSIV